MSLATCFLSSVIVSWKAYFPAFSNPLTAVWAFSGVTMTTSGAGSTDLEDGVVFVTEPEIHVESEIDLIDS